MKNRYSAQDTEDLDGAGESKTKVRKDVMMKYWWTCYAGAQNDGKGCDFWKVMDAKAEGRGPFIGDVLNSAE